MVLAGGLPDHYGALSVSRDADEAAVKKSYRRQVLLWHPDKHPAQPELAERKIREINSAYETLSNPQKRSQYDQQLIALDRKAQGVFLDTTNITPRMSIPREFMLCPMGSPDKFVRSSGSALFVHAREDTELSFEDFFKDAKFSLWWLPQQNNMCHLRAQSSAGRGVRGGLVITFPLSGQTPRGEVILSPLQDPQSFFFTVASPDFQGAFRFEATYHRGYYLVFRPPTHLYITNNLEERSTVADFVLVDYASMYKYQTIEEVLIPAVQALSGDDYVSVSALREDKTVRQYFQGTLRKAVWSQEDFETYFQGHYKD